MDIKVKPVNENIKDSEYCVGFVYLKIDRETYKAGLRVTKDAKKPISELGTPSEDILVLEYVIFHPQGGGTANKARKRIRNKWMGDVRRQIIEDYKDKHQQPVEQPQVVKQSADYQLVNKAGKLHMFKTVSEFCKTYDLDASNIRKVLKGERKTHKGWRLP